MRDVYLAKRRSLQGLAFPATSIVMNMLFFSPISRFTLHGKRRWLR